MRPRHFLFYALGAILLGLLSGGCAPAAPRVFSGAEALTLAAQFLQFGPRVSGTDANRKAGDWILTRLKQEGWSASTDDGTYRNTPVRNIIGTRGQGSVILIGAHYDSRRCADQPSGGCAAPVLGADDGASGVAVLLELARVLDHAGGNHQIRLVFFDAEDNGELDGWDWIVGSRQFAAHVKNELSRGIKFQGMVLLDMVGDGDQQFFWEGNSDPALRQEIWAAANGLGYAKEFLPAVKYTMIDDHIPFRELGIPSVDLIDFDYPFWHTTQDTLDKISADSLERVGRTLETWLEGRG